MTCRQPFELGAPSSPEKSVKDIARAFVLAVLFPVQGERIFFMSTETLSKPELYFTDSELERINTELESVDPLERVRWARQTFGEDVIGLTAFGLTSPIMLKLISEVDPDIRVVTMRFGHESKKTKVLADWYTGLFKLNLAVYEDGRPVTQDADIQSARKVEMLGRVKEEIQPSAILFGVMRGQTEERDTMPFIERRDGFLVINPVLDVTKEQVDEFFRLSGFPKNRSYTDPAKGPDQKLECGLHRTRATTSTFDPIVPSLR